MNTNEKQARIIWPVIKQRCTPNSSQQIRHPVYCGCSLSPRFQDINLFVEWCLSQVGYGLPSYALDKDILFEGNKIYSEETCVFVPKALNNFLTLNNINRGAYPIGVSLNKNTGRFVSQLKIDGKLKFLGSFKNPNDAHLTYKKAKEAEARRWAYRLASGEFIVDERVIKRLEKWELPSEE